MAKLNVPAEMIENYMKFVKEDYVRWWGHRAADENVAEMINEFRMSYEVGSSYIKVIQTSSGQSSSHSFIVNKAAKFPLGAVLKSATWKAPATNFVRADLFKPETWLNRVTWTGAQ